jgi:hypothetical protein
MNEVNDAILFSVKIDQSEAIKQSAELSKEISDLVAKQKELTAAGEQNTEAFVENAAILRSLKKEQSDVNRQIDNSVKSFDAANGSIEQQRANLSILTQQYNKLSKEERENVDVGVKLQKQIKGLSDELKRNESAIGDNRRNVGNYGQAMHEALAMVGKSNGVIGQAVGAFDSLNMVMKMNPFGIILTVVGLLIAAFSKLQPVVDYIEQAMGGLSAVMDTLATRGTILVEAFQKLLNGDFSGAADTASKAFDGLTEATEKAYEAGKKYVQVQQEIEDGMDLFKISAAEQEKQIAKLQAQLRDRTLTEKQRLAIANEITKIEKDRSKTELDLLQKSLDNEKERLILQLKNKGVAVENLKTTEALVKAAQDNVLQDNLFKPLIEAQVAFTNAEKESIALTEKVAVRRNQIIEAETEKKKKAAEELAKIEEKMAKDFDKIITDFEKSSNDSSKKYWNEIKQRRQNQKIEEENMYAEKQAALINSLADGMITQKQYDDAILQMNLDRLEEEKQQAITNFNDTREIELKIAETKLSIKQRSVSENQRLNDVEIKSNIAAAQAAQGLLTNLANVFDEGTEIQKAAALANVGINLGTALANITATSSAPTPDNLATGGISGFIKYATFLSQVLAAIGTAKNVISGAAAGGGQFYTKGPTLLLVGDNPSGRERVSVEPIGSRGKTIVNRNSNLVAMAGGGSLITDGGATYASVTQQINSQIDFKEMIKNIPAPVVKVSEINRVNENVLKSVNVSEVL